MQEREGGKNGRERRRIRNGEGTYKWEGKKRCWCRKKVSKEGKKSRKRE